MNDAVPTVLIPGLLCSARLYAEQIPALWQRGPVVIANHTGADSVGAIAAGILGSAPARFTLVGLSMGGYLAFEILRQAPARVAALALLDTSARPDTPEQRERRLGQLALARAGRLEEVVTALFPRLVAAPRHTDVALEATVRQMAQETGADGFIRQQTAITGRPDSRPDLARVRCPTLVLVGAQDELTPPDRAAEIACAIAGARLVVVPDCGHLATLERPEAVTRALLELRPAS